MLEKRSPRGVVCGRLAITGVTKEVHSALRNGAGISAAGHGRYRSGLTPVAYAGHDFRAYDSMTVGRAREFYASVAPAWDDETVSSDLALADLDERLSIRRLKRCYARSVALAFIVAKPAELVVVEHGEQFDAEPTAELLEAVVRRSENIIVTYADHVSVAEGSFAETMSAERFLAEYVR